jgi:hypothetical protein
MGVPAIIAAPPGGVGTIRVHVHLLQGPGVGAVLFSEPKSLTAPFDPGRRESGNCSVMCEARLFYIEFL